MFVADQAVTLLPFLMPEMDDPETLDVCQRWLELADIAFSLDKARRQQKQIKEAIADNAAGRNVAA